MINSVKTAKLLKIFLASLLRKFFNQDGTHNDNTQAEIAYTLKHATRGLTQIGQRQKIQKMLRIVITQMIVAEDMPQQNKDTIIIFFVGSDSDDTFLNNLIATALDKETAKLGWNTRQVVDTVVSLLLASCKVLASQPDEFMDIFVQIALRHKKEMEEYLSWLETQTKE